MADRHRMGTLPELLLAGSRPPVAAVAQVLAEQPQVHLVAADRRRGQPPLARQRLRPLIDVRRPPAPRVLVRELQETAHQPLSRRDRVLPQPPGDLLSLPAPQHRLEHRVLRTQLHYPGNQLQMRSARQISPSHPTPETPKRQPPDGWIMHPAGCPGNNPGHKE